MNLVGFIKKMYDRNPYLPFHNTARAIYRRMYRNPKRLYRSFKPVSSTKPLRCNPASQTELHTLTCHNHLFMYITGVKSLLRFVSDIAIVVHDDGSLTTKDIAAMKHHIEGIEVIRRCDADRIAAGIFARFPKTTAYRAEIANSLELTDHALLAGTTRLIITNSDTLFLQRPDEVIKWIADEGGDVLCVYEEQPSQQAEFLAQIRSSFPPHLTLGLVCLHKDIVDPAGIEEVLNQVEQENESWVPGSWVIGQNTLAALIGKKVERGKIRFLDQTLYEASGVFREGAIFRHYWTSRVRLRPQYFADAAKVIAELKSASQ
jgi:hypothetical protein